MDNQVPEVVTILRGMGPVISVEDTRPDVYGVSVKFAEPITDFSEARELIKPQIRGIANVTNYSNMTSEGDKNVVLLIEIAPEDKA